MKAFDPSRPVTLENWPKGLKVPPKKKAIEKPKPEPPDDDEPVAPWCRHG